MATTYIAKGTLGRNQFSESKVRRAIKVIGPSIAYIVLTENQYALIDGEDADILEAKRWRCIWSKSTRSFYAVRTETTTSGKRHTVFMHLLLCPGEDKSVDHRNRNSLDNRRSNLRRATPQQQSANRGVSRNNLTGMKGVNFRAGGLKKKYRARIRVDGVLINLGHFVTAEEAQFAYKKAAEQYFGEFAEQ